jgi:hypothetical protein
MFYYTPEVHPSNPLIFLVQREEVFCTTVLKSDINLYRHALKLLSLGGIGLSLKTRNGPNPVELS